MHWILFIRQILLLSSTCFEYQVLNYVLLKMSTWYSKHVEESNNIWRINNIQCITLVVLYGKSSGLWDNVEKYCRTGQATDDNMAHAHCMLDDSGYKHTLQIMLYLLLFHCNNCCTNSQQCYAILLVLLDSRLDCRVFLPPSQFRTDVFSWGLA